MIQEVCPGDTWSGIIGQLMRFSPLKKPLLFDLFIDNFIFYIPHRLVYANWEDFIAEGPMSTPTYSLPTVNVSSGNQAYESLFMVANSSSSTTYSAMRLYAYNLVYNEFFRDDEQPVINPTNLPTQYGLEVNFKKDYWTELQDVVGYGEEDHYFDTNVGSGTQGSARDVLDAIARQKIAQKRATYGTRYVDILRQWGINVNYQMLQRPEVVAISRGSANVTDVVNTSNTNLGALAGHAISGGRLKIRRKTFPEHGTLLGLTVVRPPMVDPKICDYFDRQRVYEDFFDPGLVNLPPVGLQKQDIQPQVDSANRTDFVGYTPWGEWYRKAQSRVHLDLTGTSDQFGWAGVTSESDFDKEDLTRVQSTDYDQIFSDTDAAHWQASYVNKLRVLRALPRKTGATRIV